MLLIFVPFHYSIIPSFQHFCHPHNADCLQCFSCLLWGEQWKYKLKSRVCDYEQFDIVDKLTPGQFGKSYIWFRNVKLNLLFVPVPNCPFLHCQPEKLSLSAKLSSDRRGYIFRILQKDFPGMLQDYPANTVRGRICLGLRLDWDKDPGQVFSKETSDIYIKVGFQCISSQGLQGAAPKLLGELTKITKSRSQIIQNKSSKILPQYSSESPKPNEWIDLFLKLNTTEIGIGLGKDIWILK